ncbi:MAG TPA: CvpA family protein [Albitalea sp.]|nr:CvpA family protein [Albitalea sp.]
MNDIGWVDLFFAGVLLVSVIAGLVRGLVFEVLSLVGWVVAYIGAQWLSPELAPHLPVGRPGSAVNLAAAFASAFIVVLLVWSLVARLVRLLVHATPLSLVDRVLGAGFGLARGAVVLLVITTLVMLSSFAHSKAWRDSRGAVWAGEALQGIKPMLPAQLAGHLPG